MWFKVLVKTGSVMRGKWLSSQFKKGNPVPEAPPDAKLFWKTETTPQNLQWPRWTSARWRPHASIKLSFCTSERVTAQAGLAAGGICERGCQRGPRCAGVFRTPSRVLQSEWAHLISRTLRSHVVGRICLRLSENRDHVTFLRKTTLQAGQVIERPHIRGQLSGCAARFQKRVIPCRLMWS